MIIANFGPTGKSRPKQALDSQPNPSGNTMSGRTGLWFMMCVQQTLWPVDKLLIIQD